MSSLAILETRIAATTTTVLGDRAFDPSLRRFCRELPAAYSREPRLIRAVGDMGSLFTVAAIVAKQEKGVILADVQRVVCTELASHRRVRAIVGELERTRAVTRTRVGQHSQRHQIVIGDWLPDALALWGNAYASAAYPWLSRMTVQASLDHDDFGSNRSKVMKVIDSKTLERDAGEKPVPTFSHPALAHSAWAIRFLAGWADAYERFGFLLARGYPVVFMFSNYFAGYPMLLEIIGSAEPLPDGTAIASISRKAASRSFGLSRAHFTALLVRCERLGWMRREPGGTHVVVTEPVYRELRSWVAREIAWVVDLMGARAA